MTAGEPAVVVPKTLCNYSLGPEAQVTVKQIPFCPEGATQGPFPKA